MLRIEDVPGCVTGKGKTKVLDFSRTRPSEATLYAAADPLFTLILTNKLHLKLSEEQPFVLKLEHALLDPLMRMESTPTYIDRAFLRNIVKDLTRWSNQLAARIYDEAGYEFNLGSPAAVGEFLVKKGVQLPKTKSEKQVATGEDVIGKLAEKYPVCKLVLDWRSLEKEKGTYANVLLKSTSEETPYCCFKFTSVGAPTGRFSSGGVDEGETRYAAMNVQAVPAADAYQDALARLVKNPPISEMDGSLRQIGQISFLEENLVEAEGKSLDFLWDNESPDSGPGT
jgi:DNA polymerase I-like protein with 3'-5' exonuclease and polymerase domains